MISNDEFSRIVYERYDEYKKKKRERRRRFVKNGTLCAVALIIGAGVAFPLAMPGVKTNVYSPFSTRLAVISLSRSKCISQFFIICPTESTNTINLSKIQLIHKLIVYLLHAKYSGMLCKLINAAQLYKLNPDSFRCIFHTVNNFRFYIAVGYKNYLDAVENFDKCPGNY